MFTKEKPPSSQNPDIVTLSVGFGTGVQSFSIPPKNLVSVIEPVNHTLIKDGADALKAALDAPIGTPPLSKLVKRGDKIVIITSDITRPVPGYRILPVILDELFAANCLAEDITVVFALGSHRRHTEEEKRRLVGDAVFDAIECIDSDRNDFVHLGETSHGTPVDIFRKVAEADVRIGVANIEYHYFAGYSGGAKSIMPGVSTRAAIQANHSRMLEPNAVTGVLEGNPVREDLEEALTFCPLDFIVNVVLDEKKEIVFAVAGHFIKAHREGCRFLDRMYRIDIDRKADIVIASQGGAPKDMNLYQTQKALDNATHAVREGGIVILVGACGEGLGERVFEEWMLSANDPESLIERIKTDFQLGGHKAAAIAMALRQCEIFLVSELDHELVKKLFMKPYDSVQDALDEAFQKVGNDASVAVMPFGGSTLPDCTETAGTTENS